MGQEATNFLTQEEVADILSVHPTTVGKWRERGEGPPYYKLGNSKRSAVRYSAKAFHDWLESRYTDPSEPIAPGVGEAEVAS